MDINQFLLQLLEELSNLDFVEKVDIQTEVFILKGRVILRKNHFLQVYNNEFTGTVAFSLIENERRVWGVDFDNIRGWHLHPLENSEGHYIIEQRTIKEIVKSLADAWLLMP